MVKREKNVIIIPTKKIIMLLENLLYLAGSLILLFIAFGIGYTLGLKGMKAGNIGAPMKDLNEVAKSSNEEEACNIIDFVDNDEDDANYEEYKEIDIRWLKNFLDVCHWSGVQVLLYKESTKDLEPRKSVVYNEELLFKYSEENQVFDERLFTEFKIKKNKYRMNKKKIEKMLEV